jgi:hypothetical protein
MATVTPSRPRTAISPALLQVATVPRREVADGWPPMWWVGCHGGAGTTTLRRLTGLGGDMGAAWPAVHESWATQPIVLVARGTASGLNAAAGVAEQWRRRAVPGVRVLGLVVVAGSPRRPPKVVTERLKAVGNWVPEVWRVGWVDALLAVDDARDIGVPPDVETVRVALGRILNSEVETT